MTEPSSLSKRWGDESPSVDVFSLFSLVGLLTIFWWAGGTTGAVLAGLLLITSPFIPAIVVYAIGQITLVTIVPTGTIEIVIAAQFVLLAVLTEPARRTGQGGVLLVTILVMVGLGVVLWSGFQQGALFGGVLLVAVVAGTIYLVHRYEIVQLGIVEDRGCDAIEETGVNS